jgi:hypothetical protein
MQNNNTEIFEILFALAALAIAAPFAGAGIYATITNLFL